MPNFARIRQALGMLGNELTQAEAEETRATAITQALSQIDGGANASNAVSGAVQAQQQGSTPQNAQQTTQASEQAANALLAQLNGQPQQYQQLNAPAGIPQTAAQNIANPTQAAQAAQQAQPAFLVGTAGTPAGAGGFNGQTPNTDYDLRQLETANYTNYQIINANWGKPGFQEAIRNYQG